MANNKCFGGNIFPGATSYSHNVVLRKTSDNTEQTGKASADLTASYWRQGGTRTAISTSDLAAIDSAYSSGGWKEADSTNMPGVYRFDLPNAAIATGADWVIISVKVTGCYVYHERLTLNAVLPQADSGATGGVNDVAKINGVATTSVTTINAHQGTTAANTAQTGDNFARLGAPAGASVSADIAAVKAETASIQSDTNDIQTRIPAALVSGRMDASVGAMAANVVTAAAVADGAIDRATLAADTGLQSARSNTAQAGAAGTITLDASASATTDFYVGMWLYLTGGTGAGQARVCTAYNGTTKVATIAPNWATNPDATSTFAVMTAGKINAVGTVDTLTTYTGNTPQTGDAFARLGAPVGASISADVAGVQSDTNDIQTRLPAALTAGGNMKSDALAISGDTVAADNAESFFDGTGYAGTGNVIPTVTTVTNLTNAPTSGDLTATMKTSVTTACTAATPTVTTGALSAGAITAASIAADAITAAKVASDVSDEIAAKILVTPSQKVVTDASGFVTANANGDLTATMKTSVNAEVVDALATDTYAESAAALAATASLKDKLNWLATLARNKIEQTATTQTLRKDDGTTQLAAATVSDDGTTLVRGEWA